MSAGPIGCASPRRLRVIRGDRAADPAARFGPMGRSCRTPETHLPPEARGVGLIFQGFRAVSASDGRAERRIWPSRAPSPKRASASAKLAGGVDLGGYGRRHAETCRRVANRRRSRLLARALAPPAPRFRLMKSRHVVPASTELGCATAIRDENPAGAQGRGHGGCSSPPPRARGGGCAWPIRSALSATARWCR